MSYFKASAYLKKYVYRIVYVSRKNCAKILKYFVNAKYEISVPLF